LFPDLQLNCVNRNIPNNESLRQRIVFMKYGGLK
jgi:hypothetical protein